MFVVAILGPTGVGKTKITVALGELLGQRGERPVAVSCDALQVYKDLGIITAVPDPEELAALEHRLIQFLDVTETFSAGAYSKLAHAEIDGLLQEDRRPIVVGGTGLYLRGAVADMQWRPPTDPERRAFWQGEIEGRGPTVLHAELAARDLEVAQHTVATDSQRIVRAHELLDAGFRPFLDVKESELWTQETRHPTLLVGLSIDRSTLHERINERVDEMIAAGAEDEVRSADAAGASATARKALGFSQLLAGDVEGMKAKSRQYARRQLTWMRKVPNVNVIDVTERTATEVAQEIAEMLDQRESHEV